MLNPGKSSLPHYLKESIEVYYILDGEGLMDINNETKKKKRLGWGGAIFILPRAAQYIEDIGGSILSFLCIFPTWQIRR